MNRINKFVYYNIFTNYLHKLVYNMDKEESIIKINFDINENCTEVQEALYSLFFYKFGEYGKFIKTFSLSPITAENLNIRDLVEKGFEKKDIRTLLIENEKINIKNNNEFNKVKCTMYGFLLKCLTPYAIGILQRNVDFIKAEETNDVVLLWKTIVNGLNRNFGNKTVELNYSESIKLLVNIKQDDSENIVSYKKKFESLVLRMKTNNMSTPEEKELVVLFINGLNRKYYYYKNALAEDNRKGVRLYKDTINEAFNDIVSYIQNNGINEFENNNNKKLLTNQVYNAQNNDINNNVNPYKTQLCKFFLKNKCKFGDNCKFSHNINSTTNKKSDDVIHDSGFNVESDHIDDSESAISSNTITLVMDSGTSIHVVKDISLLNNFENISEKVYGVNGCCSSNGTGYIPSLGKCILMNKCTHNLISLSQLINNKINVTFNNNEYHVNIGVDSLTFKLNGEKKLYMCEINKISLLNILNAYENRNKPIIEYTNLTVQENESKYSKYEVIKARRANELICKLGYPTHSDLIKMINNGAITNIDITAQDVKNCYNIYGKPIEYYRGTLKDRNPITTSNASVEPVRTNVKLYIDVVHIDELEFINIVVKPINLTIIRYIQINNKKIINIAINDTLSMLTRRGFNIIEMNFDADSKFCEIIENFSNFNPVQAAAGSHVPIVENKNKLLKDKIRIIKNKLPFMLPKSLIKYLVYYVVNRINMIPYESGLSTTPREAFTGLKIDMKADLALEFGDLVMSKTKSINKNSVSEIRARSCIALGSNLRGSWKLYVLETGKIITSARYKKIPITDIIINFINMIANEEITKGKRITYRASINKILEEDKQLIDHPEIAEPQLEEETHVINKDEMNQPFDILDEEYNNDNNNEEEVINEEEKEENTTFDNNVIKNISVNIENLKDLKDLEDRETEVIERIKR